jgi:hypothetical protein
MRERDEHSTTVAQRHAGKVPARRGQRRFTKVAMDDAEVRAALEEDAFAAIGPLEYRRGVIGTIRFDDERRERLSRGGHTQCPDADRLGKRAVHRDLNWHVPIGAATDARMAAFIVSMDAEREHTRTHVFRITAGALFALQSACEY